MIELLNVIGDSEALVARKASGVTKASDLVGRKVAAPFGSTAHYGLLAALQQAGVDPGAVTIVDLEPQNIQAAWQRGDIDAAYVWTPVLSVLRQDAVTLTDSAKLAAREVRRLGAPPVPGRDVGVVFQQPRLFPWQTVAGNIDAALRWADVPKADRSRRTAESLGAVGLAELGSRRTWEISGGQQQRVAIARALAAKPRLLLMDEPFAALDALTRERLQEDVRALTDDAGQGVVFVTHSVDEAVFLATRVVVLTDRPGRVALDAPITLPRQGIAADELRGSPEYAAFRGEIAAAVRATVHDQVRA